MSNLLLTEASLVHALNLAIATLVCCGTAMAVTYRRRSSLPLRHAILVSALGVSVISPILVAAASIFSIGSLPKFPSVSYANASQSMQSADKSSIANVGKLGVSPNAPADMDQTAMAARPSTSDSLAAEPKQPNAGFGSIVSPGVSTSQVPSFGYVPALGNALIFLWVIGAMIGFARRLISYRTLHRLLKTCSSTSNYTVDATMRSAAARVGLKDVPSVLYSYLLPAPLVVGVWHPRVVLPAGVESNMSATQLRSVLTHELAHIARRDQWIAILQQCSLILYWWNPLVRVVSTQVSEIREHICDDIATENMANADGYAAMLVSIAEQVANCSTLPVALGISLSPVSELDRRVRRILSKDASSVSLRLGLSAAAGLLVTLSLMMVGVVFAQVPIGKEQETARDSSPVAQPTLNQLETVEHTDQFGDRLPDGVVTRMGTVRLRHTSSLTGVVFSPDGQILVSTGWDHPIRFWDAASGRPIKQLTGTIDRGTFGAAFSPDGSHLASVGEAGLVRLWDVESGNELWYSEKHEGRTYGVAFAPDGDTFASAGGDGTVRIWDVATGEELIVLNPTKRVGDSHAVTFSPDGSLLACATSKKIYIYEAGGGAPRIIEDAHGGDIFALAFTADGLHLASGGRSAYKTKTDEQGERVGYSYAEAKLWNVEDSTLIREFGGKEQEPSSTTIALSKDGQLLASLHRDKIRVWNVASGKLLRTISDYYHTRGTRTHGIAISPDGKTVAAIGPHNAVMMWDLETGTRKLSFPKSHEGRISCVASSQDSGVVATGAMDGSVRLWNMNTGDLIRTLELGDERPRGVHAIAFSPDGTWIAAGGYDWKDRGGTGIAEVWSVDDGKSLWSKRVDGRVTSLCYSADGKKLAAAAGLGNQFPDEGLKDPTLLVWSAPSGQDERSWKGPNSRINTMSFSPDGSALMVVEESKTISTWSVESQERLGEFPTNAHGRSITSAAFSLDGTTVVSSGLFGDLLAFWDAATGKELRRIQVENTKGSIVAISPDGTLLASGSIGLTSTVENRYDRAIHLWNTSTGERLGQMLPGSANVTALAFSADGQQLFSGMNDGTLLVWPVLAAVDRLSP